MRRTILALLLVISTASPTAQRAAKQPFSSADVDAIATLLMLEDARKFDEAELLRILKSGHPEVRRRAIQSVGRIADKAGATLIGVARADKDVEVAATAVWAAGQLRDAVAIPWLGETLSNPKTPVRIAREAAIALGKIQAPGARETLATFLSSAPANAPAPIVGEALLSIGRFPAGQDLAPILRWTRSQDVDVRWRATWALMRPRDPKALDELTRLSRDPSGEVRFWAVRGLTPFEGVDPAPAAARLRDAVRDPDRRVRTEALRALGLHTDEASIKIVHEMRDAADWWLSSSAAEAITRRERERAASAPPAARAPAPPRSPRARPEPHLRTAAEYRQIVERWIVPDYNGGAKPRAIWDTPRGTIELELYPGDAPLGVEYFVRVHQSGEIVGTTFTRVVPNFVAQQRAIRNDVVLRDEVSRRGLTRGNLSWASAGLDTGRPGYTLGVTEQPHNEGNFTSLGRVVRGMEVVEQLQLNDAITGARLVGIAQAPATSAQPLFVDGQAQVVPAFEKSDEWIRETLWVETEFDSDKDGKRDRVFVDVTRPKQTQTEGLKVPVIYESSPYYAGTSGDRKFLWNVKQEVGAEPPTRTSQPSVTFQPDRKSVSNSHVSAWVPRGFAVVHSDAPGTGLSQGCVTVGADPEQLAPKAVIDWLNGRAKGFKTLDGTDEIRATWTTGKVGMTGTSYNGTLPLAAAVTGVQGLEAIIPVAPNTSYYHYYRSNGLVRHPGGWLGEDIDFLYDFVNSGDPARREKCNSLYRDGEFAQGRDRRSGDYNEFWRSRDLLTKIENVRAAVFMAHAFNDWNVVPEHSVRIYEALKGRVPLRAYFHQGGHGGPPPMEMMNKWFTRYLYGVENGVEREPKAWIVRENTPRPETPATQEGGGRRGRGPQPPPTAYPDYPHPEAKPVTLHLAKGGRGTGGLSFDASREQGRESLTDNVEFAGSALAMAASSPHRLLYATDELKQPVHISGTPQITIRLASNKPAANLSVWLVVLPWTDGPIGPANLITRGWADPQNYRSLTKGGNYNSMERGEPLEPGRFYDLTFDLQPDDQIVPAGKRIGLMIFSSDRDFTLWPAPGTELTVDLEHTTLRLPIVGGFTGR